MTASEHGFSPALRAQAIENLAHGIASGLHASMAKRHVGVAALKRMLIELGHRSTDFVDDILAARNSHSISMSYLSDVFFVLGLSIDITVSPGLDEPRGLSAAEPSSNGEGVKP
jgi:hypothetical protein